MDVDLTLDKGEFLGIVGESGCGKSTLLFSIGQLLSSPARIDGGEVWFKGDNLVTLDEKPLNARRWRDFSVVMQSAMNALNPVRTIGAQFRDAVKAHEKWTDTRIRTRSEEVLELVGIDPAHLDSYPFQLSGGMRQRAMIAMALLFTPDLILMDEPTSALDVVAQRSLMAQIKELQRQLGFAVIFVTHDMSLVSHFSDRLMVMYAGQVVELGAPATVFDHPAHPYSQGLLDAFPSIHGVRKRADRDPRLAAEPGHAAQRLPVQPALPGRRWTCAGPRSRSCTRWARCSRAACGTPPSGAGLPHAATFPASTPLLRGVGGHPRHHRPHRHHRHIRGGAVTELIESAAQTSAAGEAPLLQTKDLTRHFKIGGGFSRLNLHAVDDVNLTINRREIVALVGESGSGKSSIARLLAQVYAPTSGEIYFEGKPLSALRGRKQQLAYRGDVPMVFQDPFASLNPAYRVNHGIMRGLKLHRPDMSAAQRRAEAERVVEAVGLNPAAEILGPLPLRAVRRPAPADRLRPGPGLPAQADPGRRAGVDARRVDPHRAAERDGGPARVRGRVLPVHHPRPGRRRATCPTA